MTASSSALLQFYSSGSMVVIKIPMAAVVQPSKALRYYTKPDYGLSNCRTVILIKSSYIYKI